MSQRITIEIKDKIATCLTESPIVCGNADYVVDFVFDEEWNEHDVKTAVFVVNGKATLQVFAGNACPVPVIQNTLLAWVGVFAGTVDDGTLSTSTPALVKCIPCVTDGDRVPMAPPDDVYNQIIGLINSGILRGEQGEKGERGEKGEQGSNGADGADGKSVVYFGADWNWGNGSAEQIFTTKSASQPPKIGDLGITKNGVLFEVIRIWGASGVQYASAKYLAELKGANGADGADGKDGKDGASFPSVKDYGTENTPHLEINFGKANEKRKVFFVESFLLGNTHYGDGFMQDINGNRILMPMLKQNEVMATENGLKEVREDVDTAFGYYYKTGADRYEIKCKGLYIVFANDDDLKLCKSDGTEIVSGAQQLFIMTTPYNGHKSGTVFVAMGMYIYKSTFSITNLKIPVQGIQAELDDGSYITAGNANTQIYISEMVKGK